MEGSPTPDVWGSTAPITDHDVLRTILRLGGGQHMVMGAVRASDASSEAVIRIVSPNVQDLLGFSPDHLKGRSLRSFFALEAEGGAAAVDKLRRLDAQIAANFAGHTHAATISCLTATGSSRPLLVSIVWLGEVIVVQASAATVCEAPTKALVESIMRISHDMRTPLACIVMATSLLLQDDQPFAATEDAYDRSRASALISEISGRCHLLLARAKMTLDLHKIESGESRLALRPTNLRRELLETAAIWFWARPLDAAGAVEVDADVPEEVPADRDKVISLVMGMLSIVTDLAGHPEGPGREAPAALRRASLALELGLPHIRVRYLAEKQAVAVRVTHTGVRSEHVCGTLEETLRERVPGGRAEQALRYCNGLTSCMGCPSGVRLICVPKRPGGGPGPCLGIEANVPVRPIVSQRASEISSPVLGPLTGGHQQPSRQQRSTNDDQQPGRERRSFENDRSSLPSLRVTSFAEQQAQLQTAHPAGETPSAAASHRANQPCPPQRSASLRGRRSLRNIPPRHATTDRVLGHWLLPKPSVVPTASLVNLASLEAWGSAMSLQAPAGAGYESDSTDSEGGSGAAGEAAGSADAFDSLVSHYMRTSSTGARGPSWRQSCSGAESTQSDPMSIASAPRQGSSGPRSRPRKVSANGSTAPSDTLTDDSWAQPAPLSDDEVVGLMAQALLRRSRNAVIVSGFDKKFVYVSESMRQLTGRDPAKMVGHTLVEQVHPDDVASVEAAARGLREDFLAGKRELMRSMCMRLRFENGDYVWLNTCAVMDPDTKLVYGLSMENSSYVQQQATLEDLLAELGRDMMEPLAAIRMRLGTLATIPGLSASPDVCARLACVEHSCATLEGLANAALQVARLQGASGEAASTAAPVTRFNADQTLRDIVGMCLLGFRNVAAISFAWGAGGPPPSKVMGSKRGLNDVLQNFLVNACKFCDGTPVNVVADFVADSDSPSSAGRLTVSVTDGGRGMTADQCARVFEAYQRCADEHGGGNGLGLAIAAATAQGMGGSVGCRSEGPGRGSCFFVTIPVQLSPSAASASTSQQSAPGSPAQQLGPPSHPYAPNTPEPPTEETSRRRRGSIDGPSRPSIDATHGAGEPADRRGSISISSTGRRSVGDRRGSIDERRDTLWSGLASSRPEDPMEAVWGAQGTPKCAANGAEAAFASEADGGDSLGVPPMRCLVVDDDKVCRTLASVCLRRQGVEVEIASSGEEAFERVRAMRAAGTRLDAVLTDLTMPGGMGGLELCAAIRQWEGEQPPSFEFPAIIVAAVTGELSDEVFTQGDEVGIDLWFGKPFRPEEVVQSLNERRFVPIMI